jgi:hypothetical protein
MSIEDEPPSLLELLVVALCLIGGAAILVKFAFVMFHWALR